MLADDERSAPRSGFRPPPTLLVVAALALAAAVVLAQSRWRRHRDELRATIAEAGLAARFEELAHAVDTEVSPHEADLGVARALVYDVLDAARLAGPERERVLRERAARLERAEALAERAIRADPGSWQAAMLLGAARYLGASARRDSRLVTEAARWEVPLEVAVAAAPAEPEPRRFLAGAYLEIWRYLSPKRREEAKALFELAFADEETFERLIGPWLAAAGDPEEAFAVVPERPEAWRAVASAYAEVHRFRLFCRAAARQADALEADLDRRLVEAETRLELGDLYYGRSGLLSIIVDAPPERRFAPTVEAALARYPPGLHRLGSTAALATWLGWTLELGLLGRSPLSSPVLGRLAGAAGDLDPPQAALAALLAGEITQAESIERQVDVLRGAGWAPYLLAKARWHLDRDELDAAARLLDAAARDAGDGELYWLLRERLARGRGDLVAREEATAALAARRRESWPATAWRWRAGRLLLTALPARPARGLTVALVEVPEPGAVVEVLLDGEKVAIEPVTKPTTLTVLAGLDPSLHLVELRTRAGRQPVPGSVALLGSPGTG